MAGKRTRWKGWIRREDVEPALLAKIDRYQERVQVHLRKLQPTGKGTSDTMGAHAAALRDVPLTAEEQEILRRLAPENAFRRSEPAGDQKADPRPPFDARAWMIENRIDPDTEVMHVSKNDPADPDITVWGWEHRNVVTGLVVQFEETRRERFTRMKF